LNVRQISNLCDGATENKWHLSNKSHASSGQAQNKTKKKGLENQKEEKTKSSQMITCNHVERF
jgi:hypothetical protein